MITWNGIPGTSNAKPSRPRALEMVGILRALNIGTIPRPSFFDLTHVFANACVVKEEQLSLTRRSKVG